MSRILSMPGRVYDFAISGSQVPTEESWPEPTVRFYGFHGARYSYMVSDEQYKLIVSHIRMLAEGMSHGGVDADARRDALYTLRWLQKAAS